MAALLAALLLPATPTRADATWNTRLSPAESVRGVCRAVAKEPAERIAILSACTRAAAQLTSLLGRAVPKGVILQSDNPQMVDADVPRHNGEAWAMALPAHWAPAEPLELGAARQVSAAGHLAHEIAHRMAFAMLYPSGVADTSRFEYGSPLPDWLDEAMGLMVEPAADQRARLGLLFEGEMIYAMPLRRFLYTQHPALRGGRPGDANRRLFYGQSLAFGQFLRERVGTTGFQRFVSTLRSGTTQGVALTSIRGLPRDGGELEQAWLAWLRARRDAMRRAGRLDRSLSEARLANRRAAFKQLARSPPAFLLARPVETMAKERTLR